MVAYAVLSAHGRLRQEDYCELLCSLVYTVSSRAWATAACLQSKIREKKVGHGDFPLLCVLGEIPKPCPITAYTTHEAVCFSF